MLAFEGAVCITQVTGKGRDAEASGGGEHEGGESHEERGLRQDEGEREALNPCLDLAPQVGACLDLEQELDRTQEKQGYLDPRDEIAKEGMNPGSTRPPHRSENENLVGDRVQNIPQFRVLSPRPRQLSIVVIAGRRRDQNEDGRPRMRLSDQDDRHDEQRS